MGRDSFTTHSRKVNMNSKIPNDSPAALVAIVVAARRANDRTLERSARQELEKRFNVKLTFGRKATAQTAESRQGVADGK